MSAFTGDSSVVFEASWVIYLLGWSGFKRATIIAFDARRLDC
jgi:hypothetical protein